MPIKHFSTAALALLLAGTALAQTEPVQPQTEAVTIPAGTVLNLQNTVRLIPKKANLGDPVPFVTLEPLRIDNHLVLPRRTELTGHVTALKPQLQVTLDPLVVGGTTITFADRPFEHQAIKVEHPAGSTPPELARHTHLTAGQDVEIGVAAIIVVPIAVAIVVVASPFLAYEAIHHHGEIGYGKRSSVTTAGTVTMQVKALPSTGTYTGLPVLYILDRWHTKNNTLYCGTEPVSSKADRQDLTVRVPAGSYVFHTSTKSDAPVTVDAREDSRYLIFRDKSGLHAVDLKGRPDLLERLSPPATADYFVDYTKAEPYQLASFQTARERGGCGLERQLKTRQAKD